MLDAAEIVSPLVDSKPHERQQPAHDGFNIRAELLVVDRQPLHWIEHALHAIQLDAVEAPQPRGLPGRAALAFHGGIHHAAAVAYEANDLEFKALQPPHVAQAESILRGVDK